MRETETEPEIRYLEYVRADATERVMLAVPWPKGSGQIPPPEIIFYSSSGPISYIYGGSND